MNRSSTKRRWFRSPWLIYSLAGLVVLLIAVRLAMPYALKTFVNRQLNKSKDYSGQIGDVTVHLWPTIATLLRNAFIKSLVPGVDTPVKIQNVDGKSGSSSSASPGN